MYSGSPEAFTVPNKKSRTIAHLLVNEIIPKSGGPLQLVTDNDTENLHKRIKKMLEDLNLNHVTTLFCQSQSMGMVERLLGGDERHFIKKLIMIEHGTYTLTRYSRILGLTLAAQQNSHRTTCFVIDMPFCC